MKTLVHDPLLRSGLVVLGAAVLAVACLPKEDEEDDRDRGDSGGYYSYSYSYDIQALDAGFGPEDVAIELTREGLTVKLLDDARHLAFGMAQTAGCEDGACWVAESCSPTASGTATCHDVPPTGLMLRPVSAADHVLPSTTTLASPELAGQLTFLIDDGTQCYTWGHDPSYYTAQYDCTVW